jgi:hypothetical protein
MADIDLSPATATMAIKRGDSFPLFTIALNDDTDPENVVPVDLTGASVVVQIRKGEGLTPTDFDVEILAPATDGTFTIEMSADSTRGISYATGIWGIKVISADSSEQTWVGGSVTIGPEVAAITV